jgi:hypothetical protein
MSDALDPEADASSACDAPNVFRVGSDDSIPAADRAFNDCNVDDIIVACSADKHARFPRAVFGQRLNVAHRQEPGQTGLTGAAPPSLGQGRRWHDGHDFFGKEAGMQCPHPAVVPFRGH